MNNKRMGKIESRKMPITQLSVFCLVILFIFFVTLPVLAIQSSSETDVINQIEQNLASSSYSDFQKRMILNSVQEAIGEGISVDDTVSILKGSIRNEIDPYNVKKFFDTVISAKVDGILEQSLLDKIKEGLAKNIEERLIVDAVTQKSENMEIARLLLAETQIKNGEQEEMIDLLADSLTNGVPLSALSQILQISSEQGKSWQEVEEVSEELGNLGLKASELGIEGDKIEMIFNQAIENQDSLENICMNIRDLMIAAVAVKVSSSPSQRDSIVPSSGEGSSISDIPISSSGSVPVETGTSIPSGETGSSPVSSDDSSTSKPDSESGVSPLD